MTHSPAAELLNGQSSLDVAKVRQCLRCKSEFPSQWAGERVCLRCKSSNAWRNSAPVRTSPSGNR